MHSIKYIVTTIVAVAVALVTVATLRGYLVVDVALNLPH